MGNVSVPAVSDPFAGVVTPKVSTPNDGFGRLSNLVMQESRIRSKVSCDIKDEDWENPTCSSCFELNTGGRNELCAIGVEQEAIVARAR